MNNFDYCDEPDDEPVAALPFAPPIVLEGEGRALTPAEFLFYRNRGTFDGRDLSKLEPFIGEGRLCFRPRQAKADIIRNGE